MGSEMAGGRDRQWRLLATLIALCAWTGLLTELTLSVAHVHSLRLALWRQALFFTILSNLTVAIVFTGIALGSVRLRHPLLIGGLAMTMALVGTVFELMLRRLLDPHGWRMIATGLLHDAVPLLTAAAWFFLAEKGRLRARDPWLIALFPIVYLGYALLRGALGGTYPYPFINPDKLGWMGVAAYVAAISAVFLIFAHLMVTLDGWLARRAR